VGEQKLTKRQIQAKNTQNKIYCTAIDLLEKKGFDNLTVEEICQKAGVSIGSFYNYFKSKNDILNIIYKVADDYFKDVVDDALKEGHSYEKILRFFKFYADYNAERGLDFIKHLYNSQNKVFITNGRDMQNVLQKIIEEGQEKGEIQTQMKPREMVEYLFIAARGLIYDWCLHDGEYDLSEFVVDYMKRLVKIFII